jgi:hypothetical protein
MRLLQSKHVNRNIQNLFKPRDYKKISSNPKNFHFFFHLRKGRSVSTLQSHSKKLFSAFSESVIRWTRKDKEGLLSFCGDIKWAAWKAASYMGE